MAGPLGEMFDHGWLFYSCHFTLPYLITLSIGCDALNTTVSALLFPHRSPLLTTTTARGSSGVECSRTGTFLVDRCLTNSDLGQLLSHNMGRISYRYVLLVNP